MSQNKTLPRADVLVPDAPNAPPRIGIGDCPLVLGECVQGWLPEAGHFLITSPVDVFSWAELTVDTDLEGVVVEPAQRTKSKIAVERYLAEYGLPPGGVLKVFTPVKPGLGCGTSTADITASLRAAASAWGREISPREVSRIAIDIEPTDGSMYPGSIVYRHRKGLHLESFGHLPFFHAIALSNEQEVDSVAFDECRKEFRYSRRERDDLELAWKMVRYAVRRQDVSILGKATTASARINEQLLPKPFFAELCGYLGRSGVEGLIAAHSGSVIALLFDPLKAGFRHEVERAIRFIEQIDARYWFEITNSQLRLESAWAMSRGSDRPPFPSEPRMLERSMS